MEKDTAVEGFYVSYRMVPPGNMTYFYSLGGEDAFTDPHKPSLLNSDTVISNEYITITAPKLNYIENI